MDELLGIAVEAARAAGALLLERFEQPRTGVGTKSSGTDMVSDADRASEALIIEHIRARRPVDAILGEESGARAGSSGIRWVVDPLDGTTNFLYGHHAWAVSIAIEDEEGAVAGVVFDVPRNELYTAARGRGASCNGRSIRVSSLDDVARALIGTGFAYEPEARGRAAGLLASVLPQIRDIRRIGAAALDLAWVACGRLDGYFEAPVMHWDIAAGALIVREAGGVTASLEASDGEGLIAAGPGIFEDLRALVAR